MSDDCIPAGPGPEHALLAPFIGRFRATVTLWMGPGDPMVHTGTMHNTMILGGRFLREEYKGDPIEGFPPFEGEGYWGYNDSRSKWEGVWVDTASNQMQTEAGDYNPATREWTMLGQSYVPGGATMAKRSVIRLLSPDEHENESHIQWPDSSWTRAMHIRFVRA